MKTSLMNLPGMICLLLSMFYGVGCVPITPMAADNGAVLPETSASSPATPSPQPEPATSVATAESTLASEPTIEIPGGVVAVDEAQLADTFDMFQAPAGRQILVVSLRVVETTDAATLEDTIIHAFQQGNVYVIAEDGSRTDLESSGKIRGKFVLLFAPQASEKGFTLTWGENSAINLGQ